MAQYLDSPFSLCAKCGRKTVQHRVATSNRQTPRFVYEKGGVCRGAVHEKGRVEMRGGGEAAALRPWQDGVREEKHAVILVLE